MKRYAIAVAGAALSALYWWLAATVAFGLVAGDPGPAAPPRSEATQTISAGAVLTVAILVHAAASLAWQRLTAPR